MSPKLTGLLVEEKIRHPDFAGSKVDPQVAAHDRAG